MIFQKIAESRQNKAGNSTKGWAIFGIISCMYVKLVIFICATFILLLFMKIYVVFTKCHGADSLSFQHYFAAVALFTRVEYKNRSAVFSSYIH